MAWKVTFTTTTELPDVGTAVATYTDEQTGDVFSTTIERANQKQLSVFASRAKAELAAYQEKNAASNAIAAKLADELNKG